jgi:hypothetical protein
MMNRRPSMKAAAAYFASILERMGILKPGGEKGQDYE